jgi:hypothetical protein
LGDVYSRCGWKGKGFVGITLNVFLKFSFGFSFDGGNVESFRKEEERGKKKL